MLAPEIAYQLREGKDLHAGMFEIQWRRFTGSAASTSLTGTIVTLPLDRLCILNSLSFYAQGGAAQQVTKFNAWQTAPNTTTDYRQLCNANGWQQVNLGFTFAGGSILVPGSTIQYACDFSAGVAVNVLDGTISWIVLPRGNAQFSI